MKSSKYILDLPAKLLNTLSKFTQVLSLGCLLCNLVACDQSASNATVPSTSDTSNVTAKLKSVTDHNAPTLDPVVVGLDANDDSITKLLLTHIGKVKTAPLNAGVRGELAMAYEMNGFRQAARMTYMQAIELADAPFQWLYLLANVEAQNGSLSAALKLLGRAQSIDASYPALHMYVGKWNLDLDRPDVALHAFLRAEALDVGSAAKLGQAQCLLRLGKAEESRTLLEQLVQTLEHPSIFRALGNTYRTLGNQRRAQQNFDQAKDAGQLWWQDPIMAEKTRFAAGFGTLLYTAQELFRTGQHRAALTILHRLRSENPDHPVLLYQLALAELQSDSGSEAIDLLKKAIGIESSHYPSHLLLAEIYSTNNQLSKALEHLHTVTSIHPQLSVGHQKTAQVLRSMQNYSDALSSIEKAIEYDARTAEVYHDAGVLAGLNDEWQKASHYFEQALRLEPSNLNSRLYLIRSLAESGDLQAAHARLEDVDEEQRIEPSYQETKVWLNQLPQKQP